MTSPAYVRRIVPPAAAGILVTALLACWGRAWAQPAARPAPELTGPFVHENLAVFLVHDKAGAGDEDVVTLGEALARGEVVLEETGQVNQLVISNRGSKTVYLQAGDVVKGGRQDRTLQHDALVPPNTRKKPLNAFCVESGRWHRRGGESAQRFSSSASTLVTRKQKLAAKAAANQGQVWNAVEEAQAKLGDKMGRSVKAGASATSLQLSLEDGGLKQAADRYVRAIAAQLPARNDVVGYAFAVNGQVSAVDVYASPALFRKMKDKLIRASAVEAVAEKQDAPSPPVSAAAVQALVKEAESGSQRTEVKGERTQVVRKEAPGSVVFTTEDAAANQRPVHKSYLNKK
jgi:hypothetical protein